MEGSGQGIRTRTSKPKQPSPLPGKPGSRLMGYFLFRRLLQAALPALMAHQMQFSQEFKKVNQDEAGHFQRLCPAYTSTALGSNSQDQARELLLGGVNPCVPSENNGRGTKAPRTRLAAWPLCASSIDDILRYFGSALALIQLICSTRQFFQEFCCVLLVSRA